MPNQDLISIVFRSEIRSLSAYHVADAHGLIKLDAMENPYGLPDDINQRWLQTLSHCPLNRYPDPSARPLQQTIKQTDKIQDDLGILLGNGSDEIIQMLLLALPPESSVLTVEPGFVMYRQIAQSLGLNFQSIPLSAETFDLDLTAMLTAIHALQPSIIFLAYPNNPTGNLFSENKIHQIIAAAPGLVIIDEAYAPFADASMLGELTRYENLMVMRTLSKMGLAGLRLGYIYGQRDLITELDKIRLPYNINSLTQISAQFALENAGLFNKQAATICRERQLLYERLVNLQTIQIYPSAANFILLRTAKGQAEQLFQVLLNNGILIKNLSPQGGMLRDCLRVTLGSPDENSAFLNVFTQALGN